MSTSHHQIDKRPEFGRRAFDSFGTRKFYWEEKDEYGVYKDDQGCARDMDGHVINVSKEEIRKLLERARDEPNYIFLPEHASTFTQTKLVPEINTNDEISEMFYRIWREQEKNKEDFQMKLDGVYYPLNDSISWLTTYMEEMRQDITWIQRAIDVSRSISIDRHRHASIDSRLHASIDNCLPAGRRQPTTLTYNEVSTSFSHHGRDRSVGRRDLQILGNYIREAW